MKHKLESRLRNINNLRDSDETNLTAEREEAKEPLDEGEKRR